MIMESSLVGARPRWRRWVVGTILVEAVIANLLLLGFLVSKLAPQAPAPRPMPVDMEVRSAQLDSAVVFLGDSRMALVATSNIAERSENLAVDGLDTAQLATRMRASDLRRAKAVVLEIGFNDWWELHLKGFDGRFRAVLSAIPPDVDLVASAILPANPDQATTYYAGAYDLRGVNEAVRDANNQIAAECAARPRCVFVPVPTSLLADDQLNPIYSIDGVHLNPAGAVVWSAVLKEALTRFDTTPRPSPTR